MLIDPSIRDGVLLPLLVFVLISTYARVFVHTLIVGAPAPPHADEVRHRSLLARSARLRTHGGYITPTGFAMRKDVFMSPSALGNPDVKDRPPHPFAAMDTMKGQLVGQATYLGTFYLIQNALAGFLVLKLPFALTERFKQLTQQGLGLSSLDTSFVSSGSWYMLAQFGVQKILQLFASNDLLDDSKMMQMQMGMGMMAAQPQAFQAKAAYKAELSALAVTDFSSMLLEHERAVLNKVSGRL